MLCRAWMWATAKSLLGFGLLLVGLGSALSVFGQAWAQPQQALTVHVNQAPFMALDKGASTGHAIAAGYRALGARP